MKEQPIPAAEPRTGVAAMLGDAGLLLALVPCAIYALAMLGWACGLALGAWHLPAGILGTAALMPMLSARRGNNVWAWSACVTGLGVAILAASVWLSSVWLDLSWDGQTYHQSAILAFSQGFNPLRSPLDGTTTMHALWINHYPALPWTYGGALLKAGLSIETAKSLNLVVAAAMVLSSIPLLCRLPASTEARVLLILCIGLNPVLLYQAMSGYNDGIVYCGIVLLLLSLTQDLLGESRGRVTLLALSAVLLCAGTKFTGAVFVVVLAAGYGGVLALQGIPRLRRAQPIAMAVAAGAGLLLSHPYLTNLSRAGHPMHPLLGAHKVDIMSSITPANLKDRSSVAGFVISNASRSGAVRQPDSTRIKFPLFIYEEEFGSWSKSDVESGGFGPLYLAALLCSLTALALLAAGRRTPVAAWMILAALIASVFIHPQAWWARYVPQAWLLIPASLLFASVARDGASGALRIACLSAVLGVASALFVGGSALRGQYEASKRLEAELHALSGRHLQIGSGPFESLSRRLSEHGITSEVVPVLGVQDGVLSGISTAQPYRLSPRPESAR